MKIKDPDDIFVDPIILYDQQYPERRLYLAVILQALLDATNSNIKGLVNNGKAKAWFFCSVGVTCDNFEFVCDQAGVEPGYVRSFAYEVINSNKQGSFRYHIYRMLSEDKE
jgi:hypothetical protein|tara:strand:+ start:662 stop:994 length:333 start_codon:yes stop_codon:yes gene_type:complete